MQASDLNIKIDQLTIKEEDVTIIKYDPEAMYPLIKLKLVIKAVNYFGKRLGKSQKKKNQGLFRNRKVWNDVNHAKFQR